MLFLSTPSARRATGCSTTTTPSQTYFYPRPPRGGRLETVKTTITGCYFYPRPPRGGRPLHPAMMVCSLISIHALREEGDSISKSPFTFVDDFYPRPPRGGRPQNCYQSRGMIPFLSTPSARRATAYLGVNPTKERISIHALREEGDALHPYHVIHTDDFYPRPPRGGRRDTNQLYLAPVEISIHALREEGDGAGFQGIEATIQFLSTPSARRATLAGSRTTSSPIRFLSTPSARRATARRRVREGFRWISIHALREEGDAARSRP